LPGRAHSMHNPALVTKTARSSSLFGNRNKMRPSPPTDTLNAGYPARAAHLAYARVSGGPGLLTRGSGLSFLPGQRRPTAVPRSRRHRGWPRWRWRSKHRRATKPATSRLAAVEAAEQALDLREGGGLRVWGWESPVPEKKRLPVKGLDG
jgi:hypothetical protein